MDLREQIKKAIGITIDDCIHNDYSFGYCAEAATKAVMEVLAKQEPVAWVRGRDNHRRRKLSFEKPAKSSPDKFHWSPLYSLPGAKGEEK